MPSIQTSTVPENRLVVGLGASAGGLEVLQRFLRLMPADTGFSFLVIQHLAPAMPSLLSEILGRGTSMKVVDAQHGAALEANTVYVLPPNRDLCIEGNTLVLQAARTSGGLHLPIDICFASMASQLGANAVGIVLSGTGHDGTRGCRAILDAGGRTLVQWPEEATYSGMPSSAIEAGNASHVLTLEQMPELLLGRKVDPVANTAVGESLQQILVHLRTVTGHDFTQYKKTTIARRIERRMQVLQIASEAEYSSLLQRSAVECQLLFNELLINVTQFFRDPEAFDVMRDEILGPMLDGEATDAEFRVWIAGCASGEEAYSVAIVLHELLQSRQSLRKVQLFATDLDAEAIKVARAGLYPPTIAQDMSADRLKRYFTAVEGGYRVRKEIREMIVFAVQNVIKDPPFTRLDLLCCRNLMIYLGAALQNRLIPTFHYSLKPQGVLFLSPSESIGSYATLFNTLHRKWKFYRVNKAHNNRLMQMGSSLSWLPQKISRPPDRTLTLTKETNLAELTRRALLQDFGPASVVTDLAGNVLYVHGDTGSYLRPAPGQASLNVVDMAREGLQLELRSAVRRATQSAESTSGHLVTVTGDGIARRVNLSVRRMAGASQGEQLLLITFQETADPAFVETDGDTQSVVAQPPPDRLHLLERDLAYTRENLQATIDELQHTNEELGAANEEMQSTNEELQSSNEELETSREELQSVNEELVTVNAELQAKIEQLGDMQNDMKNLLDSINIGTIFLDTQLIIRRFTRDAVKLYRLIPKDIGRPLADISSHIQSVDLLVPAQEVLDMLIPQEVELCTVSGDWFLARLAPYRTLDNVISGVVMTFHDINSRIANERAVQAARELAEAIVDTVIEPLLLLDQDLCVVSASRSYYLTFATNESQTTGRRLYELNNGQWDIAALRMKLGTILEDDTSFDGFEVTHHLTGTGPQTIVLNARRVTGEGARPHLILLAMQPQPSIL
ncbi:chemotaxis protein CheB [Pseudomonas sp. efr-133-TYG-103a]|uniref:chemotaxis protein CheB n=1 Tax=Pseudomonas sp. efr-133-TYG-103a TaxID=3040308 RepID=UPI002552E6D4